MTSLKNSCSKNSENQIFFSFVKMASNEIIEINYKKIRIFRYIRKRLASMGFIPNQWLNGRILSSLVVFLSRVFTSVMFLLYDANSFWEYTNSMFSSLVSGVGLFAFTILTFQCWRTFKSLDFGQKLFENSKYRFCIEIDQGERISNFHKFLHRNQIFSITNDLHRNEYSS